MSDDIMKKMKDENIQYVDLRFTDPRGKMQHVTFDASMVDEDFFEDGQMFDGSSINGWKAINESDMILMPDTSTVRMDPFFQQSTLFMFCDILEPSTGQPAARRWRAATKPSPPLFPGPQRTRVGRAA